MPKPQTQMQAEFEVEKFRALGRVLLDDGLDVPLALADYLAVTATILQAARAKSLPAGHEG